MPDSNRETVDSPPEEPRWYWAAALYKATHPERPRRRHLWERTVFLLRAGSDAEARALAECLAREKEHEYVGGTGELVRWVLQEIEDVQSLHDAPLTDGAEVYWEFFERVDGKAAPAANEPEGLRPGAPATASHEDLA